MTKEKKDIQMQAHETLANIGVKKGATFSATRAQARALEADGRASRVSATAPETKGKSK
jgi:hypothetical protein